MKIFQSLLKPNTRKISDFKKRTESHVLTPNPSFDEEFQFDLRPVWKLMKELRFYVAVVGQDQQGLFSQKQNK